MSFLFRFVVSQDFVWILVSQFLTDDDAIALIRSEREINQYFHCHPYDLKRMIDYFFIIPTEIVTTHTTTTINDLLEQSGTKTETTITQIITRKRTSSTIQARKQILNYKAPIDMSLNNILEIRGRGIAMSRDIILPQKLQHLNVGDHQMRLSSMKNLPQNLRSLCVGQSYKYRVMEYFPFLPTTLTSLDITDYVYNELVLSVPSTLTKFSYCGNVCHFHFEETSQLLVFNHTQIKHLKDTVDTVIQVNFPSSLTDLSLTVYYKQFSKICIPVSVVRLSLQFLDDDVNDNLGKLIFPLQRLKTLRIQSNRINSISCFPPSITDLSLVTQKFSYFDLTNLVLLEKISVLGHWPVSYSYVSSVVELEVDHTFDCRNLNVLPKLTKLCCAWFYDPLNNPIQHNLLSLTLKTTYEKIDTIIHMFPSSLTFLDFSFSQIYLSDFASLFSQVPHLKTLKLSPNTKRYDNNVSFPANLIQLFLHRFHVAHFRKFQTPQTKFVIIVYSSSDNERNEN